MPQNTAEWIAIISAFAALFGVAVGLLNIYRVSPIDEAHAAETWESIAARSASRVSEILDQLMAVQQELLIVVRGANVLTRQLKQEGHISDWNVFAYKDELSDGRKPPGSKRRSAIDEE